MRALLLKVSVVCSKSWSLCSMGNVGSHSPAQSSRPRPAENDRPCRAIGTDSNSSVCRFASVQYMPICARLASLRSAAGPTELSRSAFRSNRTDRHPLRCAASKHGPAFHSYRWQAHPLPRAYPRRLVNLRTGGMRRKISRARSSQW